MTKDEAEARARELIETHRRKHNMERSVGHCSCSMHHERNFIPSIAAALLAAVEAEREACAKVAEGGRFLHDNAPDARFGKAVAAAIRARGLRLDNNSSQPGKEPKHR